MGKYVDTGAKREEDVQKGIHQRGHLSSTTATNNNNESLGYDGGVSSGEEADCEDQIFGSCEDDDDSDDDDDDSAQGLEKGYKPETKVQHKRKNDFNFGYHGGSNTDDWRISKGKVKTTGKSQSFPTGKNTSTDESISNPNSTNKKKKKNKKKKSKKISSSSSSSSSSSNDASSSSSEESDESIRRKKEA